MGLRRSLLLLAFLLGLLLLTGAQSRGGSSSSDTLVKLDAPKGKTSYCLVSDSLLGKDVAAMLFGSIPVAKIRAGCTRYAAGETSLLAEIVKGATNHRIVLDVEKVKGCPHPAKVFAVLISDQLEEPSRKVVVKCSEESSGTGLCNVYLTGKDVTEQYKLLKAQHPADEDVFDHDDLEDGQEDEDDFDIELDWFDEDDEPEKGNGNGCGGCKGVTCFCGSSWGSGHCFPGSALLTVEGRGVTRMDQLKVGDRVLTLDANGQIDFDLVYSFGHRDFDPSSDFVELQVRAADNTTLGLQLTGLHYIPVGALGSSMMKYARDVQVGDAVTAVTGGQAVVATVVSRQLVASKGLFNPFTKNGYLVVDGVLASSHSDWILDYIVPAPCTKYLPSVYQILFRPLYWVYLLVGPGLTTKFNELFIYSLANSTVAASQLAALSGATIAGLIAVKSAKVKGFC